MKKTDDSAFCFCGYGEEECREKKKKLSFTKKMALATATALVLVTGFSSVPNTNFTGNQIPYEVEAKSKKKDKKKPVIKFSGKSKITAYKNKSIKIPKTTAKDNKDGSVTKKLKVTVKKGKKSYSSIAKKIKANKSVKFTSTGKYTITYTVTDKAGNKATKKRYITVKTAPKKTPTQPLTEEPTTEKPTTETPTTERPTTETPTTEQPTTEKEYPIYEYNVYSDDETAKKVGTAPSESDCINLNVENEFGEILLDRGSSLLNNSEYLKFLGKITATDADGNDISNNIIIYDNNMPEKSKNYADVFVYVYVEDSEGNNIRYSVIISFTDCYIPDSSYQKLSSNPAAYGKLWGEGCQVQ